MQAAVSRALAGQGSRPAPGSRVRLENTGETATKLAQMSPEIPDRWTSTRCGRDGVRGQHIDTDWLARHSQIPGGDARFPAAFCYRMNELARRREKADRAA